MHTVYIGPVLLFGSDHRMTNCRQQMSRSDMQNTYQNDSHIRAKLSNLLHTLQRCADIIINELDNYYTYTRAHATMS